MATILRAFIIGFLIASLLFTGMSFFMSDISDIYGVELDGNLSKSYNDFGVSLNSTHSQVYEMQNGTESGEGISSSTSSEYVAVSPTIWGVIKIPFAMLSNFVTGIPVIAGTLGIPQWFTYGVISIVIIVLTLIVLSILFRWEI